ncbi:hypothetical protein [Halopseudomonas maritima]|uniref:hypothetical protein n=1 Tax=Halopseudomonas maritima TaxID=2918528 RepID=UPI001EEC1429|nr:hypothetical protein [Halopseudomonas maritima]
MTTPRPHPLAQRLAKALDAHPLQADQPTGAPLMCMPEVEEQTEHYLSIEHGDSADRGMLTGALGGMLGGFWIVMGLIAYVDGSTQLALKAFAVAVVCAVVPFLWEVLRPMPLPILFNRRTREVYFEQDGELYHTAWDDIAAAAYSVSTVGPYTGRMGHAALEALLHRFGHPKETVLINLGSPLGKRLEMQLGFWEYLRAYMNNGPFFDEQGNNSDSREFAEIQQQVRNSKGQHIRLALSEIKEAYKTNNGRNYLSGIDFVLLLGGVMFLPMNATQNFTYAIAKRRSRSRWPKLIRERLDPNGPTTRLVDLEQAGRAGAE